jgi:hypothetical protein
MSYGKAGPPKGYSVPRKPAAGDGSEGKEEARFCQLCHSKQHNTYECKEDVAKLAKAKAAVPRMSRTQMIRMGIKKEPKAVAPPPTEEELFKKELSSKMQLFREKLVEALAGEETEQPPQQQETDAVKVEKVEDSTDMDQEPAGSSSNQENRRRKRSRERESTP